jgi:hypothetical protein
VSMPQADVALMPFMERFRWCLQLTQDYDMSRLSAGAVTTWLVSTVRAGTVCT